MCVCVLACVCMCKRTNIEQDLMQWGNQEVIKKSHTQKFASQILFRKYTNSSNFVKPSRKQENSNACSQGHLMDTSPWGYEYSTQTQCHVQKKSCPLVSQVSADWGLHSEHVAKRDLVNLYRRRKRTSFAPYVSFWVALRFWFAKESRSFITSYDNFGILQSQHEIAVNHIRVTQKAFLLLWTSPCIVNIRPALAPNKHFCVAIRRP